MWHGTATGVAPAFFAKRRTQQGAFEEFREVEVIEAIDSVSPNKAPGADAIPAVIYQRLKGLVPPIRQLLSAMARSGQIPKSLLNTIIVPLDKPGKCPQLCESKRPISFINTIMKVAEIVVYNRSIHMMEPELSNVQHAYRRKRGTETQLAALSSTAHEALQNEEYAYVASLDISAAFDTASHELLMGAMWATKMDAHCARFVERWLQERKFRVRIMTEHGPVLSAPEDIKQGLPQGGAFPPCCGISFSMGPIVPFKRSLPKAAWLVSTG